MNRKVNFTLVGLVCVLVGTLFATPPTLVRDQEQTSTDGALPTSAIGGPSEQKLAQVVTVDVAGRLREVWLPVGCDSGKLVLEIQGVDAATGQPDGVVLKRRKFNASHLPMVVPAVLQQFRLGGSLGFVVGDQFAIVLSNPTGSCGLRGVPTTASYPGGDAFFDSDPNFPGWVLSPVPLPFQTWMLVHP